MKKIIVTLLVCCVLPIQAQYVSAPYRSDVRVESLLEKARLLYNERSFTMAEELLQQVLCDNPTYQQRHEAVALSVLIAYHKNPQAASDAIEDYLQCYPDAPEQNRMKALALLCYYAQGRYADVVHGMQEVNPDELNDKERDDVVLAYALSMIQEGRYEEAAVQLNILKETDIQ